MNRQTIIWTALPHGVVTDAAGSRLRLSVFVSPRLESSDTGRLTLSAWPDFLDWPALVNALTFTVQFEGKPPVAASRLEPPNDVPGSGLWKGIFRPDTYVKPYVVPDLISKKLISFPVRNVMLRLKDAYQSAAIDSPTTVPKLGADLERLAPVHALLSDIALDPARTAQLRSHVDLQIQTSPTRTLRTAPFLAPRSLSLPGARVASAARSIPPPAATTLAPAAVDFYQVAAFHGLARTAVKRPPLPTMAALYNSVDFHQILSSLGQYPVLMRRLRLVVDFEIPLAAGQGAARVSVAPQWTSTFSTVTVTPPTNIILDAQQFLARPKSPDADIAGGMLKLDDTDRFEIGQIDVDGAALKTAELANKITFAPRFQIPVAALAARTARATAGPAAASPAPPAPPPPSEEDDGALPSLRSAGLWVARVDRATQMNLQLMQIAAHNTSLANKQPQEVALWAEDLVRGYRVDVYDAESSKWYSLCRRVGSYKLTNPGRTVTFEDEGWVSSAATSPADQPTEMHVHESMFRWEGWSLVAPRPGAAVQGQGTPGNQTQFGLAASFTPPPGSLPRLRFGHEYRLRARVVDLAGNSLTLAEADDSLASPPITYFRSEPVAPPVVTPREDVTTSPGESVLRVVIHTANDSPAKDTVLTTEVSERHLLPPRTSEQMAEFHEEFDAPAGVKGDAATYQLLATHDQAPPAFVPGATLPLPYLPDPLAVGVLARLTVEPGSPQPAVQTLQIPFGEDWPNLKSIRLVAFEPKAAGAQMTYEDANHVLRVPLPKAQLSQLELSCYLKPTALPRMNLWRWTMEGVVAPTVRAKSLAPADALLVHRTLHDPAQLPAMSAKIGLSPAQMTNIQTLRTGAQEGRHWLLTPSRTVTLLHAVQQPLTTPQFAKLASTRGYGETFTSLTDDVPSDGHSTTKVEVFAKWSETVDPLGEDKPRVLQGQARVCELPLDRWDTVARLLRQREEFGDTKYRRVTYQATATSRYREYFPFTAADVAAGKVVISRTGTPQDLDVLSSARPAAPRVVYVIPTFGWQQTALPNGIRSTRSGGGLRVYLERPWFSSGDGELLGIVLYQGAAGPRLATMVAAPGVSEVLRPFVTQWGQDPLWRAGAIGAPPVPGDFQSPAATESNLSLGEVPGAQVSVVGFPVNYDEERQLWYAEVVMNPQDAYFPFVRLALARYQPQSLQYGGTDVKLSRVVLADFAQLTPDRSAVVTFDPASNTGLNVTVTGPTYNQSALGRGPEDLAVLEVSVEQKTPNVGGELTWAPVAGDPVPLKFVPARAGGSAWQAPVTLPGPRGGGKYRLVIREYETLPVDPPTTPVLMVAAQAARGRRLVYADAIEV
ncbi:MAG TPA: hypothetical protein VGM19_12405 [Armatimonadota bacterium]|jgi:hypothetical protein